MKRNNKIKVKKEANISLIRMNNFFKNRKASFLKVQALLFIPSAEHRNPLHSPRQEAWWRLRVSILQKMGTQGDQHQAENHNIVSFC